MGCGSSSQAGWLRYNDVNKPDVRSVQPQRINLDAEPIPPPLPKETNDFWDPAEDEVQFKEGKINTDVREQRPKTFVNYLDVKEENTIYLFDYEDDRQPVVRPSASPDKLYTDSDFPLKVALRKTKEVKWQRPGEFAENPQLFVDGSDRFDVGQGQASTCWFLSVLSSLADKPELLKQVIPEDAYKIGTKEYDGIFHCRFWDYGKWVDVYIDDYLPMTEYGDHWGAFGASSKSEMWVPLLEKAFAKLHGSYQNINGGNPGHSFIALTGGLSERCVPREHTDEFIFKKVNIALDSGSLCPTSVPNQYDGARGLVGGHAYVITGCACVPSNRGGDTNSYNRLLRIRNPWGVAKGEWNGPFGDGSPKWAEVPSDIRENLQQNKKGDGEFWMPVTQYKKYFDELYFCNLTPDVDEDGDADGLDKSISVFSQWHKGSCGGYRQNYLNNPKFIVSVDNLDGGPVPVCFQLIQKRSSREDTSFLAMRLDVYEIQTFHQDETSLATVSLTNFETYLTAADYLYRYSLKPGQYLLVPHTMEEGESQAFLLRAFSTVQLTAKPAPSIRNLYTFEEKSDFNYRTIEYSLPNSTVLSGKWSDDVGNSGGSSEFETFGSNPQFSFTIKNDNTPLCIALLQPKPTSGLAIGFDVYPNDESEALPLPTHSLYRLNHRAVEDIKGKTYKFLMHHEVVRKFVLPEGRYLTVLYTNEPDVSLGFTIRFSSSETPEVQSFNV